VSARRAEGGLGEWADSDRLPELEAREQDLLDEHAEEWAAPVRQLVDGYEFGRGFVEHVTVDGAKFLRNAEKLFALAPVQSSRLFFPALRQIRRAGRRIN
jgi:hypothetical protein